MKSIDINIVISMFENGCNELAKHYEYINELNVFPVPDGDTGTNMKITTSSAFAAAKQKMSANPTISEFGTVFCRQLLMNARGNSGVIFSQIIRGFFEPIKLEHATLDVELLKECFKAAKEKSYKSISNPVEGTILTIIRVISEELVKNNYADVKELFKNAVTIGLEALKTTPDLLPSLKEAKVVDSGGYGLCKFLEGMYSVLVDGKATNKVEKEVDIEAEKEIRNAGMAIDEISKVSKNTFIQNQTRLEINEEGFGYCCEFIIQKDFITHEAQEEKLKFDIQKFEKELLNIGDSLVTVDDFEIVKVHMHSLKPWKVLEIGQKYGEFLKVKIENMTQQYLDNHPEVNADDLFNKFSLSDDIKIVATCPSRKIADYLKSEFNIENVIITEETGNPSTNEIINQITSTRSRNVLVITDDSNIILSAEQAVDFISSKYNVGIIRSKNIIESIAACLVFNPNWSLFDNQKEMHKAIKRQVSGMVSSSVKTAKFNGVHVEKDDYIGITDKKIVVSEKASEHAVIGLIKKIKQKAKKSQYLYLIYGDNIPVRELRNIEKFVNENYGIKCKVIEGKQKLYKYYVGLN